MRSATLIATVLLLLSLMTGCGALRRPDADTTSLCQRGFANNQDWTRASRFSRDARKLRKEFGAVRFEPPAPAKPFHSTMWFRDARNSGFASCSRDRCETDRCLWLVRLFEKKDGHWRQASDYHLGLANKQ